MKRPLLIAHRGDPAHAPENTVASFRSAIAKGARSVEMDVRRLADGAWVVRHDPYRGGSNGFLSAAEALRFCRSRRARVFLDVKTPAAERELAALIRRSGWGAQVSVLAGTYPSLKRWRRLLPGRPVFWVTGCRQGVTRERVARAAGLKLAGFVAYKGKVNRAVVERAHRAGMELYIWTVRTRAEMRRFSRLGVDGVMSELWPAPSI